MARPDNFISANPPTDHPYPAFYRQWLTFSYALLILLILISALYIFKKLCKTPAILKATLANARACERGGQTHEHAHRPRAANTGVYGHTGEITFCDNHKNQGLYNLKFILKSSVEMLGRGSLGSTYKVILRDGSVVALKRLKETNLKQREFEQHVNKLGKLHMDNILPVQSYYYSKGLAFLVYDYVCLGSLSSLIQGPKKCKHTPLDWPTRLGIAMDVARALESLHQNSLVHGNIKSSNIFLKADLTTLISEYSIVQMSSKTLAEEATLGYKAPELVDASVPNFMSDVYSFGVLFMELLTGISPNSFPHHQQMASSSKDVTNANIDLEASDLPNWVTKRSSEKCIDPQLNPGRFETTVVQMLHVAIACVSTLVESRPSMSKVLEMMEHIRSIQERDHDPWIEKMLMSDLDTPSTEYGIGILYTA